MIGIILTLMLLIIVIIVLFWLKKALFVFGFFFKIFTLLMFVCIAASIIFGYYIIKDANDFKNNFPNSTSMIVVEDTIGDKGFVAGIIFNPEEQRFNSMTKEQLTYAADSYDNNEFRSINKEYYKIFVIDVQSFSDVDLQKILERNVELTKEEIQQVMLSDNAKDELAKIVSAKTNETKAQVLSDISVPNEEIKSYLLTYYLSTVFNPTNIIQFLGQLGNDNITVYENTALFKALKLMPTSLIGTLLN